MDKKSFTDILFFSLIFTLVILPPLFVKNATPETFTVWSFPFQQIIYAYIAGMIFWSFYTKSSQKGKSDKTVKNIRFFINSGYTLVTFGLLCTIAAITELFSHLTGLHPSVIPVRPASVVQYLYCILDFVAASFFEEVLYRLYLPDMLFRFISHISLPAFLSSEIISESTVVIIFAFSHRYLGTASVINAAIACVILRICCKKSGSVWTNTTAHFAYNILSLILLTTT
ncbi:MAG: CPBP family intramembrane metalloprotease [Treponema sp.]|nr:CPBP family intramembrane metalloprotease [Treponema sp.]